MHTYDEWNTAIIAYFSGTHVPSGTAVYLDVSEQRIGDIGQTFLSSDDDEEPTRDDWLEDFRAAVRRKLVSLDGIAPFKLAFYDHQNPNSIPQGVALLSAMTLAASHMGVDKEEDERAYFRYLRELLSLPEKTALRAGLQRDKKNYDVQFWNEWATYLRDRGLVPTARAGTGAHTYISYPISQALIRAADREELEERFAQFSSALDQESVLARLRRMRQYLNKHLRELLDETDPARAASVADALFNLYEEWREEGRITGGRTRRTSFGGHTLYVGLFRNEDANGAITFLPQPRQTGTFIVGDSQPEVQIGGQWQPLSLYRGQFAPLYTQPLDAASLTTGYRYPLRGVKTLTELVLPERPFWVLTHDSDSGLYITRRTSPGFEDSLLILCRADVAPHVRTLRDKNLVTWSEERTPFVGWQEFSNLHITSDSEAWAVIRTKDNEVIADLVDALRPRIAFGVGFVGGLRLPERATWVVDYPPQVTITSPIKHVAVTITHDGRMVIESETWDTDHPHPLPVHGVGEYEIVVTAGGTRQTRTFRLQTWADVRPEIAPMPDTSFGRRIGSVGIIGGSIRSVEEATQ